MTGESPCVFGCGYCSTGQDLADHQYWEQARCTECGRRPLNASTAVSHHPACSRLQPGYVYPDPITGGAT